MLSKLVFHLMPFTIVGIGSVIFTVFLVTMAVPESWLYRAVVSWFTWRSKNV